MSAVDPVLLRVGWCGLWLMAGASVGVVLWAAWELLVAWGRGEH